MLRDLIKEGGLYTLVNFMTKGISLLLIPFYTAYFSPDDYGVIDMFTVFGFFITGIITLQLSQGLARYVAEPTLKRIDRIEYASSAIWTSGLTLLISFIGICLLYSFFIRILFEPGAVDFKLYIYAISSVTLNAFFLFIGVYFRFIRKSATFSILSFLHALISVLLTWLLVAKFDMGISSVYISFLTITPVLIGVQLYLLRNRIIYKIKRDKLNKLLRYSIPLIPLTIATTFMSFTDRIFIKFMKDLEQLGIYGIGYKFSTIISSVIAGFSMAIAPLVFQKHQDESTKIELQKIFYLFLSVGTTGLIALSLFADETVQFLTNERYFDASTVMPYMYMTAIFVGLNMFSHGLYIAKKTGVMATITVFFAAVNIGLNFLLIPEYGIKGAAIATLLATVGQQITLFVFSQRYFKIELNYFKVIIITLLSIGIILFFDQYEIKDYLLQVLLKVLSILLFLSILIGTKILVLKKLKNYLLRKLK